MFAMLYAFLSSKPPSTYTSFSFYQNSSVHRIIGRGGFGEVYGCRKADTGKMYAMKCLDKKRIKMKQGETLALNERIMLSLVSTGQVLTRFVRFLCPSLTFLMRLSHLYIRVCPSVG